MSKRRDATPLNVAAWIARGDGQGEKDQYRPFLRVRDVPSKGRSSMFLGIKTKRTHHYLSDLEYKFHILAEYDRNVEDIREQYALLKWEEPQEIADFLGIRHPTYPFTKTPIVMTSDIVLTLKRNTHHKYAVISVKPSAELAPDNPSTKRNAEKLLIEKTYWERRSIPWKLLTEKDINHIRFHNLNNFRVSVIAKELDYMNSQMPVFLELFKVSWKQHATLNEILSSIVKKTELSNCNCFKLFGRALWLRHLPVDIDTRIIQHNRSVPTNTQHVT